jgi:uncharacterized protein (DUF1499 family)
MRRRAFIEEPPSRLAIWALRMGFFSLLATVLAIIIVRSGVLEIRPALAMIAGALAFAGIAVLLAFAAFAVIWREGLKGTGSAFGAIAIGLVLLAYPAYLGIKGYKLPWIYDITTDPIDPPRYEALARIRPRDANPIIYAGLSAAQQQRAAYPDVEPLEEEASPKAAYDATVAVITKRKWTVLLKRAPEGRRDGQIEAVARTPILGFRDDVVVRIRSIPDGSRVDVRSSSRYGSFDFGSNADRIRRFLDDVDDAIGQHKPEPVVTPPPKKQQQKAPPKGNQPSARR